MRWIWSASVAAVVTFAGFSMLRADDTAAPADQPAAETAQPAAAENAAPAEVTDEQVSYAIGVLVANDFKDTDMKLDAAQFAKGYADFTSHDASWDGVTKAKMMLQRFGMQLQAAEAKKNQEAGKNFLAENAKKEGVKTTASGLQYKVLQEGTGKSPSATDTVTVNYEGKLLDGTVFDSSYKRGKPATFPLSNVIKGWIEGVQLMKEGAKYRFFIPPDLAYGENGAGPIPPHATLIFDVELIKVGTPADHDGGETPANPATEE